MSEASFASLGPTLLARKGGAKPAMRPQLAPMPEVVAAEQLEDLGWNDMGGDWNEDENAASTANIVPLNAPAGPAAANEDDFHPVVHSPLVTREQRDASAIRTDQVLAEATMEASEAALREKETEVGARRATSAPSPAARPAKRRKSAAATARAKRANARRAAFTLRLDTDRHLKLRLAATMQGTSAQALVTEALDAMLAEIDDLDALAERFTRTKKPN